MVDLYLKIEALVERREDTHARHEDAAVQRIRSQTPRHPHIPSPFRTRQSSPEHSLRKLSDLHAGPVNIWPHFH